MKKIAAFARAFVGCAALMTIVAGTAFAQSADVTYKSTELAPGIVMLEGTGGFTGGNLGLWTGADGVILIDNGMRPYLKIMLAAIKKHAGAPVDFVINTHVHGDHIGNNPHFGMQGATIIAHDKIRDRMLAKGITGPDGNKPPSEHMLPEITFSDSVTLHLNGHRAHVMHVRHAHTDGDAIIHFPDADVIHMGDVGFNGLYPYVDLDSGGSVDGFMAAQEKVLSLAGKDTKIIPGHGPLASKSDIAAARNMLGDARDRVRKLVSAGKDDEEILAMNPLADYDAEWTWGFINTERMTQMLIKDARGGRKQ